MIPALGQQLLPVAVDRLELFRRHDVDRLQLDPLIDRKGPGDLPIFGDDVMIGVVIGAESARQ